MRPIQLEWLVVAAAVLATSACSSSGAGGGSASDGVPAAGAVPISADLFPCAAATSSFVTSRGDARTLRVEPAPDGATLWFEGAGVEPRRMDVRRAGTGFVFSSGPDAETELLRVGAAPGAEWMSGTARVQFEGWERISTPAGTYDAARIRVTTGPPTLPVVQTWWFVPGTGLVRLRSDRAGIFSDEISRSR